jgi:FkbM family methyltransferase
MRLLSSLVAQDKIAVDIGGNRGTYAYALSKLARQVHTFEPIPACVRLLRAWAEGKNITVHECGLGDHESTLTLHIPRLSGSLFTTRASFSRTGGEGIDIPVAIRTLDQFALENIGFIKIDVEGFEFSTLKGAQDTLDRCHPNILIEIDTQQQSTENFAATFAWLESKGYQGHFFENGALHPCGASIQSDQPYRCNFIFLPVAKS